MKALFFNQQSGTWLEFFDPIEVLRAHTPAETPNILKLVAQRTESENLYAAGFVMYEASAGFEACLKTHTKVDSLPYTAFILFRNCLEHTQIPDLTEGNKTLFSVSPFISETQKSEYAKNIDRIKTHLRNGDTYQINYTVRLNAHFSGNPFAWFREVAKSGSGGYLAFLELDEYAICSFSPELFFRKETHTITLKPMKGTATRGTDTEKQACEALKNSEKNRAENLMIVDMIRNDVGKIAEIGSVKAPSLFDIEVYPTVIQMTSTVTARTKLGMGIPEIFTALFPCASITGAPKIRSMEIINELENTPRGIYTGTIGYIKPNQDCVFNVAIRTAVIDTKKHVARYGTGGGIIWESIMKDEWDECIAKSKILEVGNSFYVYETLLLENGDYFLSERHTARMLRSCQFFGIIGTREETLESNISNTLAKDISQTLVEISTRYPTGTHRVRVCVFANQTIEWEATPLTALPIPYSIILSPFRVDPDDPFLRHKTSCRGHVDSALANAGKASDVILVNTRGELTESTRANIVLVINGESLTPAIESGLLPGVYREELLEKKIIQERVLYPKDLKIAEKIYIINSVRKMMECVLI